LLRKCEYHLMICFGKPLLRMALVADLNEMLLNATRSTGSFVVG
jgi:hypothetical protein